MVGAASAGIENGDFGFGSIVGVNGTIGTIIAEIHPVLGDIDQFDRSR